MAPNRQARVTLAAPEALRAIEASAGPDLQHLFALMRQGVAAIPGVPAEALYDSVTLRALALKPDIFTNWMLGEYHALKRGEVPAQIKELLAAAVSTINEAGECVSCAPYHAGAARAEGASEAEIAAIERAPQIDEALAEPARTLIAFGIRCAYAPREVTDDDIAAIRRLGYSDAAVVEIAASALIAYSLSALNQILNLSVG